MPVQFRNPLAARKQNNTDSKPIVEDNIYEQISDTNAGKLDAPVAQGAFDNLYDNSL